MPYVVEAFTAAERAALSRYTTNLDRPVFALVNMPEVVKGALFARYSRSRKSLRRLLVDEFAEDLADGADLTAEDSRGDAERAVASRAGRLYQRVFDEYGDDSVAQLGGAHVAIEQASNLLTKVIEWGRLAAYLEQSTRYVPYDDKPGGRFRYYRDPEIMAGPHAAAYEDTLDAVFETYAALLPRLQSWVREHHPQDGDTSDRAYASTVRAKACDVLRGLLPAATVSNVGVFASGQGYEHMLLRLRSHELAEARAVGDDLLVELRKVVPAFLTRVDRPDRGEVWSSYLASTREATRAAAATLLAGIAPEPVPEVDLVAWDPDAEEQLLTGMLYPYCDLPERQLRGIVERMGAEERMTVVRAYVGERANRRHKPGRALERLTYRFDICGDYGAFRDLQRHRMCTIEWQALSPQHGYDTPAEVEEAGCAREWHDALERQAELWAALHADLPVPSQYAIGFAYRLRYSVHLNARAAMQMLELRTSPQGHPSYRRVCQEMHVQIAERAGHRAVAELMRFVDHSTAGLERLEAERRLDARRAGT